ncbi:uncharacterized protein TRAVEDRAFT_54847 [Trametes versicolor FP-101664 SS1]|uniref:Uncharacterized protein n=1 Tax=Trametes versicolor (strain FP-101664) TaxID=717944 RepID=R7S602_TRAVS|nr:uncharacterized protein TRAVEDRAFT_54847 [Trametes versicolor FP-101664 SS1]EIW51148.1 hypothetical protein TRAVEDRAFT_54847 [Trametes versicolor FP-101664 SS1]
MRRRGTVRPQGLIPSVLSHSGPGLLPRSHQVSPSPHGTAAVFAAAILGAVNILYDCVW